MPRAAIGDFNDDPGQGNISYTVINNVLWAGANGQGGQSFCLRLQRNNNLFRCHAGALAYHDDLTLLDVAAINGNVNFTAAGNLADLITANAFVSVLFPVLALARGAGWS